MPNYDYTCEQCSYIEEIFHTMSDETPRLCPHCKRAMKKIIGLGGGIIFKGPGFYHTDYKNPRKPISEVTDRGEKIERRKEAIKNLKQHAPKTMF